MEVGVLPANSIAFKGGVSVLTPNGQYYMVKHWVRDSWDQKQFFKKMFIETQGQCVNTSKVYVRVKDTSSYLINRALVIWLQLKVITGYVSVISSWEGN